jgi:hypothetical protein
MAGMTKAQTEAAAQVDAAAERITALMKAGNVEGAQEVEREAEAIISKIGGAGKVAVMIALRGQVRSAMNTPKANVAVAVRDVVNVAEVDWLNDLVQQGADTVKLMTETNLKGGHALANTQLAIRRRILLEDGTPDLQATTVAAKLAAQEIYKRVIDGLPEDSDAVRAVKRIRREVNNSMPDMRVRYALSLDTPPAEDASDEEKAMWQAEVSLYAAVERADGQPLSEAIAAHYGFELKTRSQKTMEAKTRKELEAKAEPEDEAGVSAPKEESSPAEMLSAALSSVSAQLDVISADLEVGPILVSLSSADRRAVVDALAEHVQFLTDLWEYAVKITDELNEKEDAK